VQDQNEADSSRETSGRGDLRHRANPPKPVARRFRPELTRLPRIHLTRAIFRRFIKVICRLLVCLFTRPHVQGVELFPQKGPALIVINHLGDADAVIGLAYIPPVIDGMAKSELYSIPLLGWIMDAYGVIWVHRGSADRKAIRAALQGLLEGRMVGIAPEGRESLSGSLEEGTEGAAYLAVKAKVPIVPITFTGTQNRLIYGNMKRLRRTPVSLTVGKAFILEPSEDFRQSVKDGTQTIMNVLARQLPPSYRGVYQETE
jgi:1-acyl-sn-glycerol-3-phosphate acyltransferase